MLKALVRRALHRTGILSLTRSLLRPSRIAILTYHSISDDTPQHLLYRSSAIAVPPREFERQVAFLTRQYHVIPLDRLIRFLNGEGDVPARSVIMTFDDGYKDNYRYAFPILQRYGAQATFYITTSCVENQDIFWVSAIRYMILKTSAASVTLHSLPVANLRLGSLRERLKQIDHITILLKALDASARKEAIQELRKTLRVDLKAGDFADAMMSWEEVVALARAGMTIGSHTVTHPILTTVDRSVAKHEIEESRRVLERRIGRSVEHFCYPNGSAAGHFNDQVELLIRDAGYLSATLSVQGTVERGMNPYSLRRVGVSERYRRLPDFAYKLEKERLK